MPSHSKIPAWYSPPSRRANVVAPEYGIFAKPLKIGPIYDIRIPADATARRDPICHIARLEGRHPIMISVAAMDFVARRNPARAFYILHMVAA
jgi:hypothetical protein